MSLPFGRVVAIVAALVAVAAVATWRLWPAATATPATAAIAAATTTPTSLGKVTFAALGQTTVSTPLLSFSAGGTNTPPATTGTGGGAGKFTPSAVQLAFTVGGQSPLLLRGVATGAHIATTTITLYAPGTTRAAERWVLKDATVTSLAEGDATLGKPSRVTVALSYTSITWSTLSSTGAVVSSVCFNVATNTVC